MSARRRERNRRTSRCGERRRATKGTRYQGLVFAGALVLLVLGCGQSPGSTTGGGGEGGGGECPPGERAVDGECQQAGLVDGACECPAGELPVEEGCLPAGLPQDMPCAPGEVQEEGRCRGAGLSPQMPCPPGETSREDGECAAAGVPEDECGSGFAPDGTGGCDPVLPVSACSKGKMAVPGESTCRDVAPCGNGDYGDLAIEPDAELVNAEYAGVDSDGSPEKPWKTIQEAIDAAAPGGLVAIAAGTYTGDLLIQGKAVRLWGRCPGLVHIAGSGGAQAAITVAAGASGSVVRGISVTGPNAGVLAGASGLEVDQVWVIGSGGVGVDVVGSDGVEVKRSLIEAFHDTGVRLTGATATVESCVIRGGLPVPGVSSQGRGVKVRPDEATGTPSEATVLRTVMDHNRNAAVIVFGGDLTLVESVIRDTQSDETGKFGRALEIGPSPVTMVPSNAVVERSVFEDNHDIAIIVSDSHALLDRVSVRDTQPLASGIGGDGLFVQSGLLIDVRSSVGVARSVFERNRLGGITGLGVDLELEAVLIRDTLVDADGMNGNGVVVQESPTGGEPSNLVMKGCRLDHNRSQGVLLWASNATIDSSVFADTEGTMDGVAGWGLGAQSSGGLRADVKVVNCLFERNQEAAIAVFGSDADIDSSVLRDTKSAPNGSGQGLVVSDADQAGHRADVKIRSSLVDANQGAGIFVWGSTVTMESSISSGNVAGANGSSGRGLTARDDPQTGERSDVTILSSLIDGNDDHGVVIDGSDLDMTGSLVRGTQPTSTGTFGRGLGLRTDSATGERAIAKVTSCVFEENHEAAIGVHDADLKLLASIVRETLPRGDGTAGRGVAVERTGEVAFDSPVTIEGTIIEDNSDVGLVAIGASLRVAYTQVKGTRTTAAGLYGRGIGVQQGLGGEPADASIECCRVEGNHDVGILVAGANASIEGTVVRDTLPDDGGQFGQGVVIQLHKETLGRGTATIRSSTIEGCHEAGLLVAGADVVAEGLLVQDVRSRKDGLFGDGIQVLGGGGIEASATLTGVLVKNAERVGIAAFGATAVVGSTAVMCCPIPMNSEPVDGSEASFERSAPNACSEDDEGCELAESLEDCRVAHEQVEAPHVLDVQDYD